MRHLVLLALVLSVACSRGDALPGYTRATGDERAALMRAVADYYAVRERAFVSGDSRTLFAAYPRLAQGEDVRQGINLDPFWIPHMRELGITSVTSDLEGYEPARIYIGQASAVAFVHGWETWSYDRGGGTGLEFFTRIDLVSDADRWVVERTDEQMMAEPPPRTPAE